MTSQQHVMVDNQQLPVDRGWAWMIVLGYFTSVFCMAGIGRSFGIFMEEFVRHFDTSVAMAAAVMGVYGGVYTLSAPICVSAGEQWGQRRVVMVGGVIGAAGLSLAGLLFNMTWVIVVVGLMFGIGNGSIFGNGLVMLNQYFDKRRSLANGLALSGASIGLFAIPPLLQVLLDKYALQGTLVIVGGIYLNVTACGALYRPLSYFRKRKRNDVITENQSVALKLPNANNNDTIANGLDELSESQTDSAVPLAEKYTDIEECGQTQEEWLPYGVNKCESNLKDENNALLQQSFKTTADDDGNIHLTNYNDAKPVHVHEPIPTEKLNGSSKETQPSSVCASLHTFISGLLDFRVLRNPVAVLFVISSFLFFFGHFNFLLFMPSTAFSRGISKYDKAYLVSINGLCDLVGRLSVGAIGDLKFVQRYTLLAITTFFCGASIFSFTFTHTFLSMAICCGLYGFFGGGYVTINVPSLIDLVGMKAMPKVLAVVLFIQGIGAAVGLPLLGALHDVTGSYYVVHCINGIAMMLGSLVLLAYPCVRRRQTR